MQVIVLEDIENEIAFAKEAAKHFTLNPGHTTYSRSEVKSGELFAVRWGLHNKAVLIFKIAEDHTPVVYGDIIETPNQLGEPNDAIR